MMSFRSGLRGEEFHPMYSQLRFMANLPPAVRSSLAWFLRNVLQWRRASDVIAIAGQKSVAELWCLVGQRDALRREYFELFASERLDAILCPGTAIPAVEHGASKFVAIAMSYTYIFNLLNVPVGSVPVARIRADETDYQAPADQHDSIYSNIRRISRHWPGLPMGVQVAGLPFRDEMVLHAMRTLERALPRSIGLPADPAAPSIPADLRQDALE